MIDVPFHGGYLIAATYIVLQWSLYTQTRRTRVWIKRERAPAAQRHRERNSTDGRQADEKPRGHRPHRVSVGWFGVFDRGGLGVDGRLRVGLLFGFLLRFDLFQPEYLFALLFFELLLDILLVFIEIWQEFEL